MRILLIFITIMYLESLSKLSETTNILELLS